MEGPAVTPTAVVLEMGAWAQVLIAPDQWPAQRRRPGPAPADFPSTALRQADEQSVAGLAAVYQALHDHGEPPHHHRWGVIGCPRFQGRSALKESLQRYAAEGAWAMSPHFIPHRSLHSLAGLVSQLLGLHGPNFGVDGSRGAGAGLLAAASLLRDDALPGLWLIETGFVPELPPPAASPCQAVALALRCYRGGARVQLAVEPAREKTRRQEDRETTDSRSPCLPVSLSSAVTLPSCHLLLAALRAGTVEQTWSLAPGLQLHLRCEHRVGS